VQEIEIMQAREYERQAIHELPALLAGMLDLDPHEVRRRPRRSGDRQLGLVLEAGGHVWVVEVKRSSSPGTVATTANQLRQHIENAAPGSAPLLVVPYMTKAGAEAAAHRHLNWIDLSGNARLRDQELYVWVEGKPNRFPQRGRPSSPFAPKSARATRLMLVDPWRWWRQKDLAEATRLDDGHLSRVVRRLHEDELLDHRNSEFRPRDPELLLDAWADDYRFDRHDVVVGHMTGSGAELASRLSSRLTDAGIQHAFTGLPAAWALGKHSRFRLCSVYVEGDPREAADTVDLRRNEKGANVQLIGPDDDGVFDGQRQADGLTCVSPSQVYLDLLHLPERAKEAAAQLREDQRLWSPHE
jgi:hypothetical protein